MVVRDKKFTIRTAAEPLHLMAAELLAALTEKFKREDIYASCITCLHFQDKASDGTKPREFYCKKFKAYPPIHVIVNACDNYDDNDDIPF